MPIRRPYRIVLAVAAAAFSLRAAVAWLTTRHPIFPPFYYHDARQAEALAVELLHAWRAGAGLGRFAPSAERAQAALLALVYAASGPRPLLGQLLNAALGAGAALLLFAVAQPEFGAPAALASAGFVSVWPSHAFNTSQNFKEGPALFLCWGALAALLAAERRAARRTRPWGLLAAGLAALSLLGLLRVYLVAVLIAALAMAWTVTALRAGERRRSCLVGVLTLACALPLHHLLASWAFAGPLRLGPQLADDMNHQRQVVFRTYDTRRASFVSPLSPNGLSETRRLRQEYDQVVAARDGRRIETQLFVGQRFESWFDVARFLPKGAAYVLFMPLPLLFDTGGRLGPKLACLENCALLVLAFFAALRLRRGGLGATHLALLAYFALMASGSALLDLDLGAAARHRLMYFPALLPFAFEELLALAQRSVTRPPSTEQPVISVGIGQERCKPKTDATAVASADDRSSNTGPLSA